MSFNCVKRWGAAMKSTVGGFFCCLLPLFTLTNISLLCVRVLNGRDSGLYLQLSRLYTAESHILEVLQHIHIASRYRL